MKSQCLQPLLRIQIKIRPRGRALEQHRSNRMPTKLAGVFRSAKLIAEGGSALRRFCCKSRLQPIRPLGLLLRAAALDALPLTLLTQLPRYAMHRARTAVAERPATRAAADSERGRPEQIRPGRLVGHAVEADRVSGCASSVRTASRSSCAPAATAPSPRCQRTTGQRPGHAHGYRAGSCEMVPSGSIAV